MKAKILISMILTLSFLAAGLSGIMLFLSPKGRIAHWVNWSIWGLDKEQWEAMHLAFVGVMLIAGLLHLFWINWRPFWSYVRRAGVAGLNSPVEITIAVLLTAFLWIGVVYEVPPAISPADLADQIDLSYELDQNEPPIPHAEELTLGAIAAQFLETDSEGMLELLREKGYVATDPEQTLGDVAAANGVSPRDLLARLSEEQPEPEAPRVSYHTPGQGKMTIAEYCELKVIPLDSALVRLRAAGIADVTPERTLKGCAADLRGAPADVARIIHLGPGN